MTVCFSVCVLLFSLILHKILCLVINLDAIPATVIFHQNILCTYTKKNTTCTYKNSHKHQKCLLLCYQHACILHFSLWYATYRCWSPTFSNFSEALYFIVTCTKLCKKKYKIDTAFTCKMIAPQTGAWCSCHSWHSSLKDSSFLLPVYLQLSPVHFYRVHGTACILYLCNFKHTFFVWNLQQNDVH